MLLGYEFPLDFTPLEALDICLKRELLFRSFLVALSNSQLWSSFNRCLMQISA